MILNVNLDLNFLYREIPYSFSFDTCSPFYSHVEHVSRLLAFQMSYQILHDMADAEAEQTLRDARKRETKAKL